MNKMNFALVGRYAVEGVFPTRAEADAWAKRTGMRTWRTMPTDRPCWTRW